LPDLDTQRRRRRKDWTELSAPFRDSNKKRETADQDERESEDDDELPHVVSTASTSTNNQIRSTTRPPVVSELCSTSCVLFVRLISSFPGSSVLHQAKPNFTSIRVRVGVSLGLGQSPQNQHMAHPWSINQLALCCMVLSSVESILPVVLLRYEVFKAGNGEIQDERNDKSPTTVDHHRRYTLLI